jgi:hypothetical protein
MGEITVLTMAAIGVFVLMRMPSIRKPALQPSGDGQPADPEVAGVSAPDAEATGPAEAP